MTTESEHTYCPACGLVQTGAKCYANKCALTAPTEPTGAQADAAQRCPDCNRVLNRCWCADLGKYGAVPRLDRGAPTAEPTGAQADELVRRFSCFEVEDGVYEHANGSHVAYADYARARRDLEAARGERDARPTMAHHMAKVTDLRAQLEAATGERDEWKKNCSLLTHQLITCGVAASHPDATLSSRGKDYGGPWDSPQAQQVRTLRADRDSLRAQLASAAAELGNIAHAKRFDRAVFWSDTEFADWAQSRCHAALSSDAAANKERE